MILSDLVTFESSNVVSAQHREDGDARTLRITFRGNAEYDYADVPREVFDELRAAESAGSFIASRIKGVYACERVKP